MNNFVWITPNYRVNIDSIFSLQKINNENDIIKWNNLYDQIISNPDNYPDLPIGDNKTWNPVSNVKVSDEEVEKYAEAFEIWIRQQIGPKPTLTNTCTIILSTGVKVTINEEKYNEINKIIDKITKDNS